MTTISADAASPDCESPQVLRRESWDACARPDCPEASETARLLELTCRMSPNSVVIADARRPDMPIVFVNAAFEKLTGYSSDEVVGRNCRFLQGADRDQKEHLVIREALLRGESCEATLRNYRKDGSLFHNHVTISPLQDGDGRTSHFAAFQIDVSASILAEEELRWKTAFLEAKTNSSRDGILVVDQRGRKILQNQRMVDLFKIPRHIADDRDDAKQVQWLAKLIHNPEGFIEKTNYLYAHPNEIGRDEVEMKSGTILDRYSSPVVGEDGKHYGRLWTFCDISEQRRAENRLRSSHARYRSLVDNACDAIFSIALNGAFTSMNPASEAILGLSRAAWIGEPFAASVHPDDLPLAREMQRRVLRGEQAPVHVLRVHPSLSRPAIMELTLAAQKDESGKITGMLGVGRDITERKRSEAELEKLHQQLVDASRRSGMAEVATNVLHNVGNVLNSVNVSTALILRGVKNSRMPNLDRVVALLRKNEAHLGEFLINDSQGKRLPAYLAHLSESLIAEQATTLHELDSLRRNVEHVNEIVAIQQNYASFGAFRQMTNVAELVEDSLRMSENAFYRHRLNVVRDLGNVPAIYIDKHKILQILINLLRNAKHACQESEQMEKRLAVQVTTGDGQIMISVTDNGIGIPTENLARLFNHGFTTRKDGHGFGLHGSSLAAKEMGGSLTAHSDGPGTGATFTLRLPCGAPEEPHN